ARERHLHHPGVARGPAGTLAALRLRRERPARGPAAHGAALFRGAAAGNGAPLPAGERLASQGAEGNAAMKMWLVLLLFTGNAFSQERTETRELIGQLGSRVALMVLHQTRLADGSWQLAGEYLVLPTLQRRYLEGDSSPEIGVTTLREGATPILFGRPPSAELRGTLRGGTFKGTRYGPGGQERERFEFGEEFPAMSDYGATVRCEARDARYSSSLSYAV